jgi:hypothetical protein
MMGMRSSPGDRCFFAGLAICLQAVVVTCASAADVRWQGAGTGGNTATSSLDPTTQWARPANWQPASMPTADDHAILDFENSGTVHTASYHVEDLTASGSGGTLMLDGESFRVDDFLALEDSAQVVQSRGVHTIGRGFEINQLTGQDAYVLEGGELRTGFDVPWWEADVEIGRGGFTQRGGVHHAAHDLWVWSDANHGGYRLIDGTLNIGYELRIYASSDATFHQSGGQLNIGSTRGSNLSVATVNSTLGRFALSGGTVSVKNAVFGNGGRASLIQSGGDFNADQLLLAYFGDASATVEQSGGLLKAKNYIVAREGDSTVTQSGGRVEVEGRMTFSQYAAASSLYELIEGELDVHYMQLGGPGTERLIQRAGTVSADVLSITDKAVYEYHGGELVVSAGFDIEGGTLDFSGQPLVLDLGPNHIVDLTGKLLSAGQTSWNIGPDSLTILPAGFNPNTAFASYTNAGHAMTTGTRFVLPAGQTIRGGGEIDEFLEVHGLVEAADGHALDLRGVAIGATGMVNLRSGQALIDRSGSGIEGGQLSARRMRLTTSFTQSGGSIILEQDFDQDGTYTMRGGSLSAQSATLAGQIDHDGGQINLTSTLSIQSGGYVLRNGDLATSQTGMWSRTTFEQSGGIHRTGRLVTITGAAYTITSGKLFANEISVGGDAGGFVTIAGDAVVEVTDRVRFGEGGVFEVGGGTLRAKTLELSSVRGNRFNWSAGRLELENAIGAPLTNSAGVLAPTDFTAGDGIGPLTITSDYLQTGGSLEIELAGVDKGTQYDHVLISGAATLAGALNVSLIGDFEPSAGDFFEVLRAENGILDEFSTTSLPTLPEGLNWNVIYSNFAVLLSVAGAGLDGDYDEDGSVNAADYVVWRKTGGSQAGFDLWRTNFGRTVGAATGTRHTATPGAGSAAPVATTSPRLGESTAAVPEPASYLLVLAGIVMFGNLRRV